MFKFLSYLITINSISFAQIGTRPKTKILYWLAVIAFSFNYMAFSIVIPSGMMKRAACSQPRKMQ